jgi:hypothetical protein
VGVDRGESGKNRGDRAAWNDFSARLAIPAGIRLTGTPLEVSPGSPSFPPALDGTRPPVFELCEQVVSEALRRTPLHRLSESVFPLLRQSLDELPDTESRVIASNLVDRHPLGQDQAPDRCDLLGSLFALPAFFQLFTRLERSLRNRLRGFFEIGFLFKFGGVLCDEVLLGVKLVEELVDDPVHDLGEPGRRERPRRIELLIRIAFRFIGGHIAPRGWILGAA